MAVSYLGSASITRPPYTLLLAALHLTVMHQICGHCAVTHGMPVQSMPIAAHSALTTGIAGARAGGTLGDAAGG